MTIFRFLILAFLAYGCSCGSSRGVVRIGVDPFWYPVDFGPQTSYVNGYTEDLLIAMASYSGMKFELVKANWDSLVEGMKQGKYDAIITTLPPYEYHRARYDFSENFLSFGPVLVVPYGSSQKNLSKMEGEMVGIIANDPSALILEKYPKIIIRSYNTIPDLLNAAAMGDVQGVLLSRIPAVNYIADIYKGVLTIAGDPLTDQGIHMIGPKGGIKAINKNLEALRKKKMISDLQNKWGL